MTVADEHRLEAYQARLAELAGQLGQIRFLSAGTLLQRFMTCGKPRCRCQADPPQRHGPYWQWSTRVDGKIVTRRLSSAEARLYQEGINNRRRLRKTVVEMERISEKVGKILLQQPDVSLSHTAEFFRV